MTVVADVLARFRADFSDLTGQTAQGVAAMKSMQEAGQIAQTSLDGVHTAAVAGGAAIGGVFTAGVVGAIAATKEFVNQTEQMTVQFNSAFGKSFSTQAIAQVEAFADKMGLPIQQVKDMAEALQLSGVKPTNNVMTEINNAAAATGQSVAGVSSEIATAYQQWERLGTGGTTTMRSLTTLLNDHIITVSAYNKLLAESREQGASPTTLFQTLTQDLQRFNGAGAEAAHTFTGLKQTFDDLFTQDVGTVFQPLIVGIEGVLGAMNKLAGSQGVKEVIDDLSNHVSNLAQDFDRVSAKIDSMGSGVNGSGLSMLLDDIHKIGPALGAAAGLVATFSDEFLHDIPVIGRLFTPFFDVLKGGSGALLGLLLASKDTRDGLLQFGDAVLHVGENVARGFVWLTDLISKLAPFAAIILKIGADLLSWVAAVPQIGILVAGLLALVEATKLLITVESAFNTVRTAVMSLGAALAGQDGGLKAYVQGMMGKNSADETGVATTDTLVKATQGQVAAVLELTDAIRVATAAQVTFNEAQAAGVAANLAAAEGETANVTGTAARVLSAGAGASGLLGPGGYPIASAGSAEADVTTLAKSSGGLGLDTGAYEGLGLGGSLGGLLRSGSSKLGGAFGGLGLSGAGLLANPLVFGGGALLGGLGLNDLAKHTRGAGSDALHLGGDAMEGAGAGAAIGSIVPGIGTGAGALIGGLLGLTVALHGLTDTANAYQQVQQRQMNQQQQQITATAQTTDISSLPSLQKLGDLVKKTDESNQHQVTAAETQLKAAREPVSVKDMPKLDLASVNPLTEKGGKAVDEAAVQRALANLDAVQAHATTIKDNNQGAINSADWANQLIGVVQKMTGASRNQVEETAGANKIDLTQRPDSPKWKQALEEMATSMLGLNGVVTDTATNLGALATKLGVESSRSQGTAGEATYTITQKDIAQRQSEINQNAKAEGVTPINVASQVQPGNYETSAALSLQMSSIQSTQQYASALQQLQQALWSVTTAQHSMNDATFQLAQSERQLQFTNAALSGDTAGLNTVFNDLNQGVMGFMPVMADAASTVDQLPPALARVGQQFMQQLPMLQQMTEEYDQLNQAYQQSQNALQTLTDQEKQYQDIANQPLQGTKAQSALQEQYKVQEAAVQQQMDMLKLQNVPSMDPRMVELQYQMNVLQAQADAAAQQATQTTGQQQFQIQQAQLPPEVSYQQALSAAQQVGNLGPSVVAATQATDVLATQTSALNTKLQPLTTAMNNEYSAIQAVSGQYQQQLTANHAVYDASYGVVTAQQGIITAGYGVSNAYLSLASTVIQIKETFASTWQTITGAAQQSVQNGAGILTGATKSLVASMELETLSHLQVVAVEQETSSAASASQKKTAAAEAAYYQTIMQQVQQSGKTVPYSFTGAASGAGGGPPNTVPHMAGGGILHFYANGGGSEDHSPQIATAGTRVWAEPETGGEAYIPMGLNKRAGSMAVLKQVMGAFGLGGDQFANGGISSFAGGGVAGAVSIGGAASGNPNAVTFNNGAIQVDITASGNMNAGEVAAEVTDQVTTALTQLLEQLPR